MIEKIYILCICHKIEKMESSSVFKQVLKHKGFFSYSDLYAFCYQWLKDEGYSVKENSYTEKVSGAKEILIEWTAEKAVTDYFQNVISLKWHILGMTDAEVERGGKKEKTNKGDLKMTFSAEMQRDYESRWEGKVFNKFLRGIYDKYIIRTTKEEYEGRLKDKAESFVEDTKSFLMLEGKR